MERNKKKEVEKTGVRCRGNKKIKKIIDEESDNRKCIEKQKERRKKRRNKRLDSYKKQRKN